MDLTEFLLARIDEDEAVARIQFRLDIRSDTSFDILWDTYPAIPPNVAELVALDPKRGAACALVFNLHPDPARVLAECEAKRRIVAMLDGSEDFQRAMPSPGYAMPYHSPSIDVILMAARLLAQPYASHPDFNPAWRL